jgi:low affinity Fe/Cu permease
MKHLDHSETKPSLFHKFAHHAAEVVGSPPAFYVAVGIIVVWAAVGPMLRYSDTWQLAINTLTTLVTFLMVFLIQHTQNRDAKALHLKLDELIRGVRGARTELVALEEMSDEDLERLDQQFKALRHRKNRAGKT